MMKKFLMGTVCSAVLLSSVAVSNPSATGFFVGLKAGGAYTKLGEYARHTSQKAKDQVELVDVKKNFGFIAGIDAGYGYEMNNGFYIGGKIYGIYDATKIDGEDGKGDFSKTMLSKDGSQFTAVGNYEINEAKPQYTFGAAVQVGGKLMPCLLAYASLGVEMTKTKIKQYIYAEDFALQNDFGMGTVHTYGYKKADNTEVIVKDAKFKDNGSEEMDINLISVVPGIGVKWFFTPSVYVGAEVDMPIGISKKADAKYFNKVSTLESASFTDTDSKMNVVTLEGQSNDLYVKRNLGVRYGLTIGMKF